MSKWSFSILFLLGVACFAGGQTDRWLEISTQHFLVVSNAADKDARRVALQFERMRSVFHTIFPEADLNTATPIVILAVEDKANLQALEPKVYLEKGQASLSGLFLQAPEKNYVLVWRNAPGLHPLAPIYHEYAHFALGRTGGWMPLWLSEGWAQFYQTTEILDDKARVGKLDAYTWDYLQRTPLLPLPVLLTVDEHSPYYHEEEKGSIFYAESWALTHYLKAKDDRENTHRLNDYLDLLHKKVDPVAAAVRTFGDLDQLQLNLKKYILNGDYSFQNLGGPDEPDESSFKVRTLGQIEVDSVRADFLAYCHREKDAQAVLQEVLRGDPDNVPARETMAFIALRERNFSEARKWSEQAIQLDSRRFMAHYYFAVAVMGRGLLDVKDQAAAGKSLRTAIDLNPAFAPAYDVLAVLLAARSKTDKQAEEWIQKAIRMDPGNVQFWVDAGGIQSRLHRNQEAAETLDFAMKLSHTSEETAAVENALRSVRKSEEQRRSLPDKRRHYPAVPR